MARPRKADQLADLADLMCDDRAVHVAAVRAARQDLPSPATVSGLAGLFAALGDPTRLRIVAALASHELCVCDLAAAVGHTVSAVSHHLRQLRTLGLVQSRRDGRLVYYALDDDHVAILYGQGLDHVGHRTKEGQS